jgi:hypothetical protein
LVLLDNGAEVWRGPLRADDSYEFAFPYSSTGSHGWIAEVRSFGSTVTRAPTANIDVRLPLKLDVPSRLDLGIAEAGSAWSQHCTPLDMGRSQAAAEHRWEMWVEGASGCTATIVLGRTNAAGRPEELPLSTRVVVDAFDPDQPQFPICIDPASCAPDASPPDALLHLRPLTPEFAEQKRAISLAWQVTGRPWLRCHAWWLGPTVALLSSCVLIAGFLRPARFPPTACIRIAGSEAGLRRSPAIILRGCAGARARFFRDACLALRDSGELTGDLRGAPVRLRAVRPSGVLLQGRGPIEVFDAAARKWRPVDDLASGHSPSPRAIFRAGGAFFQVDAG